MSEKHKTEPKNAREVVLEMSVFYDCTKTTPEKLAEEFDGLFRGVRALHREQLDKEYGPTHCNKLHVPEPLQIVDGELESEGKVELAAAGALIIEERGCDHNHELVVLNAHGQAWVHVYLDYYANSLQIMVNDVSLPDGDDRPVIQHYLSHDVARERQQVIRDTDGEPMDKYEDWAKSPAIARPAVTAAPEATPTWHYDAFLLLEQELVTVLSMYCNGTAKPPRQRTPVFDKEVTFRDGMRMAIQVCPSGPGSDGNCWTQGVLFDADGNELGFTEVGDEISTQFKVRYNDTDYVTTVLVNTLAHEADSLTPAWLVTTEENVPLYLFEADRFATAGAVYEYVRKHTAEHFLIYYREPGGVHPTHPEFRPEDLP